MTESLTPIAQRQYANGLRSVMSDTLCLWCSFAV